MFNDMVENKLFNMYSELGLDLLDQTQRKFKCDSVPSTRVVLMAKLKTLNNLTQVSGATFTLKRKYHDDDDVWLHRYIHRSIIRSRIWKDKEFILIPEYTKKGILHYHGVIFNSYESEVMKMIKWWRRLYGFVKPELKIINIENWTKYITKDYGKTGLWTIYNVKDTKSIINYPLDDAVLDGDC